MLVVAAAGMAAAVATAAADSSAPGASSFVIQGDRRIGGLAMGRGTPREALDRFGVPGLRRSRPPSCIIAWPRLGLTINFLDFERRPCTNGGPVVASITNRARWRTLVGLRVGDGVRRLRTLYPRASRRTGSFRAYNGFWLVTRRACETVGGHPYPGLLARVREGRVSALVVRAGVCE